MSRGKGGEIRRNDGFRIADARQVRIEALEKTVQRLRRELDQAQREAGGACREVQALCSANAGLVKQRDEAREQITLAVLELETTRSDLSRTKMMVTRMLSERVTWWNRLFGAKA